MKRSGICSTLSAIWRVGGYNSRSVIAVVPPIADRGLFLSVERQRIFEKKGFN